MLAGACASPQRLDPEHDPWEGFNRKMFWFNERVDEYVLEPAGRGWDAIASEGVQRSVSNFFANLRFPRNVLNNLLQWQLRDAGEETGRFVVNTTVGLLGFFDPATDWGLEAHEEDFGQTLARWGVAAGPYLVLPIWGPSSPRDGVGLGADYALNSAVYQADDGALLAAQVVYSINARALLLEKVADAKEASLDYYVAVRNAYIQTRQQDIDETNGGLPEEQEDLYDVVIDEGT